MTDAQRWQWIILIALSLGLLYLLAPVLTPFVAAALLAYLGDPLADRLEAWKLNRTLAVVVVFVVLTTVAVLLLLVLVPMVEKQFGLLVAKTPAYVTRLRELLVPLLDQFTDKHGAQLLDWDALTRHLGSYLKDASGTAGKLFSTLSRSGMVVAAWLANLVLIPVVAFYLLRDWDRLVAALRELLPRRIEPTVTDIARESDEVLGAFVRGQLLVMLGLGTIYTIGLWIVGLDLALLVGLVAGLVSFVPYLGFIIGILLAGVLALIQFHDMGHLLGVVGVFAVGQAVEGMLLTPLLVGERIGLHPVAVIFSVLAGGQLFGFFGVLLALPVAAVIAVILRHLRRHYVSSELYDDQRPGPDQTK